VSPTSTYGVGVLVTSRAVNSPGWGSVADDDPGRQRVITAHVSGQRLSGLSVDELVGCDVHVHPLDFGILDAVGAPAGGFFITTKPEAPRCATRRSAVIRAIMSSAWWTRLRPS
jgi:hypothetical protein